MQVDLNGIGKKFADKWILRNLTFTLKEGSHHAIVGKNGSGKSTLLMIIAGYLSPTRGEINWHIKGKKLDPGRVFSNVAIASPYLELIEDFSLEESIAFQQKFKPFQDKQTLGNILELSGLQGNEGKPIKNYSSGMKQRARLVLSIMSHSELLLLDEPCANLDQEATAWYRQMIETFCHQRTLVICSNHNTSEYHTADNIINISNT